MKKSHENLGEREAHLFTINCLLIIGLLIGTCSTVSTYVMGQKRKVAKPSATRSAAITSTRPLDGAFIQFWGVREEKVWRQVMDAMKTAKMRTVVIQYLKNRLLKRDAEGKIIYGPDERPVMDEATFTYTDAYTMPNGDRIIDPTQYILQYAEDNGMQVYVGLINDERFVEYGQWDNPHRLNLDGQLKDNKDFAQLLWERYGKNPKTGKDYKSLAGWYLPYEMWNEKYTTGQLDAFRPFFNDVSETCRRISHGKPVTVSPFINPDTTVFLDAKSFAATYGTFLKSGQKSAGIDIVMLQDSVGAKGVAKEEIQTKIGPYFKELNIMCNALSVKLWADIEAFEDSPRIPTTYDRFERQMQVVDDILVDPTNQQVVAFDFFHYMNPYGHLHGLPNPARPADGPDYAAREGRLYCAYLRALLPSVNPPPGTTCER